MLTQITLQYTNAKTFNSTTNKKHPPLIRMATKVYGGFWKCNKPETT